MRKKWFLVLSLSLALFLMVNGLAVSKEQAKKKALKAQTKQEHPVSVMTKSMADVLTKSLHVKKVVGDPVKVGKITLIPIIMIDVGYGGGGGGPNMAKQQGGSGFYMSGEAKPLGFVVISKAGIKFISVGKAPRK